MNKSKDRSLYIVCAVVAAVLLALALLGNRVGRSLREVTVPGSTTVVDSAPTGDYFAIVAVRGVIQNASADISTSVTYNHYGTINYIYTLVEDSRNQGIFLDIDTNGGSVYETDELYLALEYYKAATGRPVVAYVNRSAYSGGYYVAMAADTISANRNGMTGSIGVIITHTDYSALYENLGIRTDYIVSGANKSMGAGDKPLTEEQLAIYQSVVDESYQQFVEIVCASRGMDRETLLPLADGRIYTALQALDLGLIDKVQGRDEALYEFSDRLGGCQWYYKDLVQYSLLDRLFARAEALAPKSDAELVQQALENAQNGTPFYLAV